MNNLTIFLNSILAGVKAFARGLANPPVTQTGPTATGSAEPVRPRVLLINFNPTVPGEGGRKLNQVLRWNDPDELTRRYIEDVRDASYGYVNYEVVDRIEADEFPAQLSGFQYTADSFVQLWRARDEFKERDWADYLKIVNQFNIIERINKDEIDEVWMFGFPYGGFYESRMAGPGAFWCNAPPLQGTDHSRRRFVIMGFSYERGVGEMLENLGHRAESIIQHVFRHSHGDANLWQRFIRYDQTDPNKAEVGLMHFAPNSLKDYDWGNRTFVNSNFEDWRNFPNFKSSSRQVNCLDWGEGDIRQHHLWWFRLLPHVTGSANGISYNWWEYIINPNLVR